MRATGTAGTKDYYEDEGWAVRDGVVVEAERFGVIEDGELRRGCYEAHLARMRQALATAGHDLRLMESGGGGQPAVEILDMCADYVALDFSRPGLELGREALADFDGNVVLAEGDMCALPFPDAAFDAVYCAHALYHVAEVDSQKHAFDEIVRILRPGGVAVLIVHNPRPLLFPGRMIKRIVADTPVVSDLANRIRQPPPIPYKPLRLGIMRKQLAPHGTVEVVTAGMASHDFNRRVTELRGFGKRAWQTFHWLETKHPHLAARLGYNVQITFVKD